MTEKIKKFNIYKAYFPENAKTTYVLERLSSTGGQYDWQAKGYSSLFELADNLLKLNSDLSLPISYGDEAKRYGRKLKTIKENNVFCSEQSFPLEEQKTLADLICNNSK